MRDLMDVEKLTDEKWLNLYRVRWTEEDGTPREWIFASRQEQYGIKISPSTRKADAVIIVPIMPDIKHSGDDRLVITKEFRAPIADYEYGFPAGLIDKNESPLVAAIRELKEETGLEAISIPKLSPVVFSSVGMTDESVQYAFVYCRGSVSSKYLDDGEDIEAAAYTIEELRELMIKPLHWSAKAWPFINNCIQQNRICF